MSKKSKYILGAILSLIILGGCEKRSEDNVTKTTTAAETVSETEASAAAAIPAKAETETVAETAEKSKKSTAEERASLEDHIEQEAKKVLSEGDLENIREHHTKVEDKLYGDFDCDGSEELVACYYHDWWYTNGKNACILQKHVYNYTASMLDTGEQRIVMLKAGNYAYLYTFKDGEAAELDISGKSGLITDIGNGVFTMLCYDVENNISKPYWLYFENGQFKEYTGEKITKDDFIKYSGGKAVIGKIEAEGGNITEIIYRKNNIVNINYTAKREDSDKIANKFLTLDVSGETCKELDSGGGAYLLSTMDPFLGLPEEQLALHKLILEAAGEQESYIIQAPIFEDFDGDGANELVAVLSTQYEADLHLNGSLAIGSLGEIWFAGKDKAYKLDDSGLWGKPYILKANGQTILNLPSLYNSPIGGSDELTYSFLVKNSEATEIESIHPHGLWLDGAYGDFTTSQMVMDGFSSEEGHLMGRTWKTYWCYYIDDKISVYYGKEISKEEFLKYDGAKELLDGLEKKGYSTDNILKRGNGVININYSKKHDKYDEVYFDNLTLLYRNGKVIEKETGSGIYDPCFAAPEKTEQTDFERFSEMIYDTAEGDENSFIRERFYGDHDGDGKNELYAYYGTDENFSLWFADENGARQASEEELAGIAQTL